jgi:glucokinase
MMRAPVVLGLDFGGTKIAVAVADLTGARLGAAEIPSGADSSALTILRRTVTAARALVADIARDRAVVAVGASTFGIPFDNRVDLAPQIPGWSTLALGRELRAAFPGVPVAMATDVKAAAAAEYRWGALVGCDPAIYLNLGTGLAAAIITRGEVVTGAHGAAGEIAYNIRHSADLAAPARQRQTLEDAVSGRGLAATARERLGQPLTGEQLFGLAPSDASAAAILDEFGAELAQHVVNLAIAIDPIRIAVGGGMVRSWARIGPGLRRALNDAVPFPPELVVAQFPYDAALIGALALAVEAAGAESTVGALA